ncbi:MAG: DUF4124 domain-containing protein [Gammaproteobacteria bacterium]|nr:DUF4124 domain-containing protein [Gammaproteobacteria bacterium]
MRTLGLLACLLLLSGASYGAVYRWIDADGSVQYGDSPPRGSGAEEVELPELSTYAPPPAPEPPAPVDEAVEAEEKGGNEPRRYRYLAITQPFDGQTIRTDDGRIHVAVDLRPALQESAGHRLVAVVDGRRIPGDGSRIPVRVPRGSHRLQVAVIDSEGRVVARSPRIAFDVRPKTRLQIPSELGGIEGLESPSGGSAPFQAD